MKGLIRVKRSVDAGQAIFLNDIADVCELVFGRNRHRQEFDHGHTRKKLLIRGQMRAGGYVIAFA